MWKGTTFAFHLVLILELKSVSYLSEKKCETALIYFQDFDFSQRFFSLFAQLLWRHHFYINVSWNMRLCSSKGIGAFICFYSRVTEKNVFVHILNGKKMHICFIYSECVKYLDCKFESNLNFKCWQKRFNAITGKVLKEEWGNGS